MYSTHLKPQNYKKAMLSTALHFYLRCGRNKGDMHCDVMMVVERVTVKRRMGNKGKEEREEVEKDISLSVSGTLI